MRATLLVIACVVALAFAATPTYAQDKSPPPVTSDTASKATAVSEIPLAEVDLKAIDDAAKVLQDADRDAQQAQLIVDRTKVATDRAQLYFYTKKIEILSRHKLSLDEYDVVYARGQPGADGKEAPGQWVIQRKKPTPAPK